MQLLHSNCLSCHNPEKHKGGLVLSTREQALAGGDNGSVFALDKPEESVLLRVLSADADPHMPPKKQLSTNQIELVRRWIAAGAPWNEAALSQAAKPRDANLHGLPEGYHPVLALELSPDETRLAFGRGSLVVIHDLTRTNLPLVACVEAHRDAVRSLAWSPDGRKLASGSYREIKVWDTESMRTLFKIPGDLDGRISALRFTPYGGALVAADGRTSQGGSIRLFAAGDGRPLASWPVHADEVLDLAISADGGLLATAGADKVVRLWEVVSQQEIAELEGHTGAVLSLALNPNATELVSVGADHQLRLWDVKTHQSLVTIGNRKQSLNAVAWSADGKAVAAGDDEGRLSLFTEFTHHTGAQSSATAKETQLGLWNEPLHCVAITADAKRVYAGGQDGTVYFVATDTKQVVRLEHPLPSQARAARAWANFHSRLFGAEKLATRAKAEGSFAQIGSHALRALRMSPGPASRWIAAAGSAARQLEPGFRNIGPAAGVESEPALPALPLAGSTGPSAATRSEAGERPSFIRDVLPLLSKAGCNAGSCHAKAEGQNGFKLSVFNYDPRSDFHEITKDMRGRRVFPAAPEESLLLLKPTMAVDHGGGQRIEPGSETYETLIRWIRAGMIFQHPGEPALAGIRAEPSERSYEQGAAQQLKVIASYSDGSTRHVTHLADYQSTDKEVASVDERGLVRVASQAGECVVVARFMGFVDASRVTVPSGRRLPPERYAELPVNNFIDELAYSHFKKLGLLPSEMCTDSEFLRRASLDAIGRIPTPEEAKAFLADTDLNKRRKWIDRLLEHPGYADYWANKWADLVRPNPDRVGVKSVFVLDQWLRESFRANAPYDQFVRSILLAEGSNHREGPTVIYRDRREPSELTTMFSQLFLGVRLECARCHHHPNEKWSQEDFYQFAAFFGSVKQKGAGLSPPISAGTETFYFAPGGSVKHPVTDAVMSPRPPDGSAPELAAGTDPRRALADWLTGRGNPFFARAAVNRVWAVFFGRGLVEPVDDFRISNPASNQPLLDAVAQDFARHGHDLKHLMRTILRSHLYQLSSLPNDFNVADTKNFSRSYRRRLPAEVLLDAVSDITGVPEEFSGCPPGTRAMQTWSYKIQSHFLDAFSRPNSSSDCPCERDTGTSVVQSLHLMNAKGLQAKLGGADGRVAQLAKSERTPAEIVTELYLASLTRHPTAEELRIALGAFEAPDATRQTAAEDVLWALLNSAEFVFNH